VRILDAIQDHVKAAAGRRLFKCGVSLRASEPDYALVRRAAGRPIQLLPRFETNRHAALPAQIDDLLDTRSRRALRHQNPVERPPGPKRFPDGMDSCERRHYDKGTLMSAHENAPVQPTHEIPDKLYFRIGEVARLAGIKPYVLRFWETEFPSLGPKKSGTGHRLYRRKEVEMVLEIKRLLYEKRFTIEGARKFLDTRGKTEPARPAKPAKRAKVQADLFSDDSPVLDVVRKELRAIADILK
jgi:DNA-binding transcriptional MerR regulator